MRRHAIEQAVTALLEEIEYGEKAHPHEQWRPGLLDTPRRVADAYREWFGGYDVDVPALFKTFEDGAQNCDEMIVLDNIEVHSHCEHHLAPFIGKAVVGYIPAGRIIGLSKIPKLVRAFSKRLQVQERLTNQIAEAIIEHLQPRGVGVIIRAEHMCMSTRGAHAPGVFTTTSALRGCFLQPGAREEFLQFARSRG